MKVFLQPGRSKKLATNGASFWLRRVSTKLRTLFAMAGLPCVVHKRNSSVIQNIGSVRREFWLWHLYCAAATEELIIEAPSDEAIVVHGSLRSIRTQRVRVFSAEEMSTGLAKIPKQGGLYVEVSCAGFLDAGRCKGFGERWGHQAKVSSRAILQTAAISLAGNRAGQANVKVTVLITPEEMDQAAEKSQGLRAPGA